MLRTSVCLLAGARLGAAQGSLSDDVAVLLAFKAHGSNAQADGLDTWVSGGDPCGAGFDDPNSGFAHVMCCDAYSSDYPYPCTGSNAHRVTYLDLSYTAVDGDVSGLAGLTQLSGLYLDGTGCYGDSSLLPSSVSSYSLQHHLDYCSSSHDACPAGRTPVSSPDTYVGSNACACCSGTQKLLDSGTGACVDPGA